MVEGMSAVNSKYGSDNHSIPKRRELVKEAARLPTAAELKETQLTTQEYQWSTCPLSQKPLEAPIVSDYLGRLYNKDAIVQSLLPSTDAVLNLDELGGRVKSLKDIVEVRFETKDGKYICPIQQQEIGPGTTSVYVVPCGHACSLKAVDTIESTECFVCGDAYDPMNVVVINATGKDLERNQKRKAWLDEQGLPHSLKKSSKKRKKEKVKDVKVLESAKKIKV
jgi:hypothetical protein